MVNCVRFAAVGDLYLGGLVAASMAEHGPGFVFQRIAPTLRRYDLTFGNLEAPLTHARFVEKNGPNWRADPGVARVLRDAGLQVLNLSNNHIGDCGNTGITDTLTALAVAGLEGIGVGRVPSEARTELVVERRGVRVAFLGYCDSYQARDGKFGGAPIREDLIAEDIARARTQAECVIVSLHHGIEYSDYPEPRVINLCRALVDCGAGIVLGHHPHVIQGWEHYGRGVIVHSLGNFVADFADSACKQAAMDRAILVREGLMQPDLNDTRTEESVIFTCSITPDGPQDVAFVPIVINHQLQPTEAQGTEAGMILTRLERISEALSNPLLPVYADLERVGLKIAMERARPSFDLFKRLHRIRPRHARVLLRYARAMLRSRTA